MYINQSMKNRAFKTLFFLFFIFFTSVIFAQNRFSNDEELKRIYTFQYNQESDSLKVYFTHQNPIYREAACLAFASVQDTNIVSELFVLLPLEKQAQVRKAIIYSLGQMNAWQNYKLVQYFDLEQNLEVKGVCLEAIAKTSKKDLSDFFANIQLYSQNTDYMSSYWRALYFANKRKNLNVWHEGLNQRLNQLDLSNPRILFIHNQLFKSAQTVGSEGEIQNKRIQNNYTSVDAYLKSISSTYKQHNYIKDSLFTDEVLLQLVHSQNHSLVRYEALDRYIKKYWQMIGWNEKINSDLINKVFESGDVALISRMAEYIKDQNLSNRKVEVTKENLILVQQKLVLPRDFEVWVDLEKAILSFEGKKYQYESYFTTGYQNPIDWNYIVKVPQNQKVKIKTNKGEIVLVCKVNEAPASVANFLKLVDSGYYDGKYFHRMVPNFVVQGGCPRGDGWGSLSWNQRSEFSNYLSYQPGSVGLASVGKDSEGVQFFITHTYTQNLDGRYTIFAEVVKGMDIVNQLLVGDVIVEIELLKD
jgi:cyclophilin family peptidyl-prolyl cis-trans isomerase